MYKSILLISLFMAFSTTNFPTSLAAPSTSRDARVETEQGSAELTTQNPQLQMNNMELQTINLQGASFEGLANMAMVLGREASQMASSFSNYIRHKYFNNEYPSPLPPCFIQERNGAEMDGHVHPDTNFLGRLVEDYHSAVDYINYMRQVGGVFNDLIQSNPNCTYCAYLADTENRMKLLKDSLANLIKYVNSSISLTVTAPPTSPPTAPPTQAVTNQGSSQDKQGVANTGSNSTLPDHCTDVCFQQQHRIYQRVLLFSSTYISNDISGLKQQKIFT